MGELIITSPDGKVTKILVNTEVADHVLDSVVEKHLEYYAPTEQYLVDFKELY
jgi:hypothetical protein